MYHDNKYSTAWDQPFKIEWRCAKEVLEPGEKARSLYEPVIEAIVRRKQREMREAKGDD